MGATLGNAPYGDCVLLRSAFGIALSGMRVSAKVVLYWDRVKEIKIYSLLQIYADNYSIDLLQKSFVI